MNVAAVFYVVLFHIMKLNVERMCVNIGTVLVGLSDLFCINWLNAVDVHCGSFHSYFMVVFVNGGLRTVVLN